MNITANRNESLTSQALALVKPKAKTPDALVSDAVASIEASIQKMAEAHEAIEAQKAAHEAEIAKLQAKADECDAHSSRLGRIRARFEGLLA